MCSEYIVAQLVCKEDMRANTPVTGYVAVGSTVTNRVRRLQGKVNHQEVQDKFHAVAEVGQRSRYFGSPGRPAACSIVPSQEDCHFQYTSAGLCSGPWNQLET
eukprot:scpid104845/ scgid4026/ 